MGIHREKNSIMGKEIIVKGPGRLSTTWTVIPDIKASDTMVMKEYNKQRGVRGFDFGPDGRTVADKQSKRSRINFMDLFRHLWPL